MANIVLFGPPGAGKGTQSQNLIQQYQLAHLAPGDLLRAQVRRNTPLGQQVAQYINEGKLAPEALVIEMLAAEVAAQQSAQGFLFDGFPRTLIQAHALEKSLATHRRQLDVAILLEVPEEALIERIQKRAQTSGRVDDQDAHKVARRMRIYHEETLPLADYYAQQKKLFRIDGLGSMEDVFERIVVAIKQAITPK